MGDIIRTGNDGDVVLLGYPEDRGVGINEGRLGARLGPEKFRHCLKKYGTADNPEWNIDLSCPNLSDAGDIPNEQTLEETHSRLREKIGALLKNVVLPFAVGGGNDQSYPNAAALMDYTADQPIGVINIDAHLDIPPPIRDSGSRTTSTRDTT